MTHTGPPYKLTIITNHSNGMPPQFYRAQWALLHVILKAMLASLPGLRSQLSSEITLPPAGTTSFPGQPYFQFACSFRLALPKWPTITPAALFLFLPTLALIEKTKQFYYFETSQITQWLGEECPALILSASSLQSPAPAPGRGYTL